MTSSTPLKPEILYLKRQRSTYHIFSFFLFYIYIKGWVTEINPEEITENSYKTTKVVQSERTKQSKYGS